PSASELLNVPTRRAARKELIEGLFPQELMTGQFPEEGLYLPLEVGNGHASEYSDSHRSGPRHSYFGPLVLASQTDEALLARGGQRPQAVGQHLLVLLDAILHYLGTMPHGAQMPVDRLHQRLTVVTQLAAHGEDRHRGAVVERLEPGGAVRMPELFRRECA